MSINRKKSPPLLARSIWSGNAGSWNQPNAEEIVKWLGWLRLPDTMLAQMPRLESFAAQLRADGVKHVVLLGMGGSSLAPLVMASLWREKAVKRVKAVKKVKGGGAFPKLHVLDSTDPAQVAAAEKAVELRKTVFIVASKSGTTIEPNCFYQYFRGRLKAKTAKWARQFVAITDAHTALHKEAREKGFRDIFIAPSDVGGRYSALSFFGLVPAACIGIPLLPFLENAREMAQRCGGRVPPRENVGAQLGLAMALAAMKEKNKLTLILPPRWETFGLWIEQLIAESTGKQGKGIVPIAGEPLAAPDAYGSDRFFVHVKLAGRKDASAENKIAALRARSHPVTVIEVGTDRWAVRDEARPVPRGGTPCQLGAEFFRWEFATAMAGAALGINPFDQPDVQAAKEQTSKIISKFVATKKMPSNDSFRTVLSVKREAWSAEGRLPKSAQRSTLNAQTVVREFLATVRPNDYLALLAYLPENEMMEAPLQRARRKLRDRFRVATTFGYGPRYLHSTGQLHKGGANHGVFIVLTADARQDLAIPDEKFTFAQLQRAQALGDIAALEAGGRRVLRLHLPKPDAASVKAACALLVP